MSSLVPPPCYSPCREGMISHTSVCIYQHMNQPNGIDGSCGDGPRSAPMYPHEGPWPEERLPSPYSFEDLPGISNHPQEYLPPAAPSSMYTQSYLLGSSPAQLSHETMAVTSFDSHTPLESPSRIHAGHVSAPNILSLCCQGTSRSRFRYHQTPASQPIISHLSYQPPAVANEPDDEGPDVPQCQNMHSGSAGYNNSRLPKELLSMSPSASPGQGRPTNFVFLSRKSTFKHSTFSFFPLRQKSESSSSITGSFFVDPHLRLPPGLLKAVDSELAIDHAPTTSASLRTQKNLVLEVENGSINVHIHLTPSTSVCRFHDSSTDPSEMHREPRRPSTDKRRLHSDPVCAKRNVQRSYSYSRQTLDRDAQIPTRMECRLKEGMCLPSSEKYTLIARVNAPNPRPPMHLLVSTIENNPPTTTQPKAAGPPPPPNTTNGDNPRRTQSRRLVQPRSHPRSRSTKDPHPKKSNNKSPVYLHLPRTLHGPLTIHVASGNIDEHVRLSKELGSIAVILSESALSRGYFVSSRGLADFGFADVDPSRDGEDGWIWVARPDAGGGSSGYDNFLASGGGGNGGFGSGSQDGGWYGDKVDVVVGDGRVYLQFVDEEDPFGRRKGFWQSLGLGCR